MPRLWAVVCFGASLLLASCGDGAPTPPPQPGTGKSGVAAVPPIVERAIAALGGRERLSAVRTTETVAVVDDGPLRCRVLTQVLLPGAYRDEVETDEARFVRVWRDGAGFASLDGYRFALSNEESAAVREALRLAALALLVDVDPEHGAEIRALPAADGCERVEVRFADEPGGPYELRFDPADARMRSVRFSSHFMGRSGTTPARLELSEWRAVDGGYAAAFRTRLFLGDDEKPASVATTERVAVNATLLRETFEPPAGEAPVLQRDLGPETVALWERKGADGPAPADAEERLAAFVAGRGLVRRGPVFRLLAAEESPPAVGVAVVPPAAETRPSASAGESLRVTTRPGGRVLTLAGRADEASLRAGVARLSQEAAARGSAPAGPCRVVAWSAEVAQLQLPVRPR
jgi:hypothetical protein